MLPSNVFTCTTRRFESASSHQPAFLLGIVPYFYPSDNLVRTSQRLLVLHHFNLFICTSQIIRWYLFSSKILNTGMVAASILKLTNELVPFLQLIHLIFCLQFFDFPSIHFSRLHFEEIGNANETTDMSVDSVRTILPPYADAQ